MNTLPTPMRKPRALDLFCKAGGASMGLHNAGFEVTGVDIEPQPNYPFAFVRANALKFPLVGYDLVWASPPCQAYTVQGKQYGRQHPKLIEPIRDRLLKCGIPYIIENVVGAPLRDPITLCGSMFGLNVRRHRKFESNLPLVCDLRCRHEGQTVFAYYGAWGREAFRAKKPGNKDTLRGTVEQAPRDMGIDWMTWEELTQAIPPAYAEFLARQVAAQRELATLAQGEYSAPSEFAAYADVSN